MEHRDGYYMDRYQGVIAYAKEILGGTCTDCGSGEDLEFDHVDPSTKLFSVTEGWARKAEDFWLEVAKCVLRCAVCHKIRSDEQKRIDHGAPKDSKRRCQCEECKEHRRQTRRDWRAKRRAQGLPA